MAMSDGWTDGRLSAKLSLWQWQMDGRILLHDTEMKTAA
jgi:hypothetical protein